MSSPKKSKQGGDTPAGFAPGIPSPPTTSVATAAAAGAAASASASGLTPMPTPSATASPAPAPAPAPAPKPRKISVGRFAPEPAISGKGAAAMTRLKEIGLDDSMSPTAQSAAAADLSDALHDAARGKREHEQVNTAEGPGFVTETMLGKTDLQRSVVAHDGDPYTVVDLQADQRLKTFEYLMKPKKGGDMKNEHADAESDQYYLHGHVGAAKVDKGGGKLGDVVEPQGASVGLMHTDQLKALRKSRHLRSLSARLDKVTDKYQAGGEDILSAFEDTGFHADTRYMRPSPASKRAAMKAHRADTALGAHDLAVTAEINKRKRQTRGKKIREQLPAAASDSDDYSEISSGSEIMSGGEEAARQRIRKKPRFRSFRETHGIPEPTPGGASSVSASPTTTHAPAAAPAAASTPQPSASPGHQASPQTHASTPMDTGGSKGGGSE